MRTPRGPLWLRVLLIVGLALALERLIETDAEELESLARRAAQAAQAGDREGLADLLAEDFRYGSRDKAAALDEIEQLRRTFQPAQVEVDLTAIQVSGDEAEAICAVLVTGGAAGRVRLEADARFVREGGRWRFLRVSVARGSGLRGLPR